MARKHRRVQPSATAIQLLHDGTEAFPAMRQAINGAEQQILVEMYCFAADGIGQRFGKALREAAARNVDVVVIYDAFGSSNGATMLEGLVRFGVRTCEFNPVAPWRRRFRLDRLRRRNHRKLLVVDNTVAFVGGINFADPWQGDPPDRLPWRDDVVKIQGTAVRFLARSFARSWKHQAGEDLALRSFTKRSRGAVSIEVLEQRPPWKRSISKAFRWQLARAHQRMWIANAYFLPPYAILRQIERAALRGVDVRIMVPQLSNVRLVEFATRALYVRLLKKGVRIFELSDTMLHSKIAVIDGRWSTVGSFNLDARSTNENHELNIATTDRDFASCVEASFEADQVRCREVSLKDLRFRSFGARVLEWLSFLLRRWL